MIEPPESVVIRMPNWVGDAVMALPALEALRRHWPGARRVVQVHPRVRALVAGGEGSDPLLDVPTVGGSSWAQVIGRLHAGRHTVGILFPPSLSSALLFFLGGVRERVGRRGDRRDLLLTRALPAGNRTTSQVGQYVDLIRAVGFDGDVPPLRFRPPHSANEAADAWLARNELAPEGFLAVAPGAAFGPAKTWPAAKFVAAIRAIRARHSLPAVLVGAPSERKSLEALAASAGEGVRTFERTDLAEAAALLSRARLLLANDSGALHLGRAVGVPVVGLYASTSPAWTGPDHSEGEAVASGVDCSPCFHKNCPLMRGRYVCMEALSLERVLAAVERHLEPIRGMLL